MFQTTNQNTVFFKSIQSIHAFEQTIQSISKNSMNHTLDAFKITSCQML